ncbi:MAG TPA: transporter substrate-binding domain-containing protein, partial [Stellaceae bacterium]|nr:transporter substrate-binding domain-containing protein [Stellaceae bacterium]
LLTAGGLGIAIASGAALGPRAALAQAAQAPADSLLRQVLSRGTLRVGTGSTNAPWHFEDDAGKLTGMDIAMARILAKALFDDETKIEFVKQEPAARVPNITTGKVDIVIQFMTMTAQRAQVIAFSRPYYVEGVALLLSPKGKYKDYKELLAAKGAVRASVLQNVSADALVKEALPDAQVLQLDTQANVIQALDAGRADAAVVDLSTVRWMSKRAPDRYIDAGHSYRSQLYGAGLRQGDLDWLQFVNTAFTIQMFGHDTAIYDKALADFFGLQPPERHPGFPTI